MSELVLEYLIREPQEKTENPRIFFLLHGYGSNMHDLFSVTDQLPADAYVVSFNAPHSIHFGGSAWYNLNYDSSGIRFNFQEILEAKEIIEYNIDRFIKSLQSDHKSITIIGFSQGAILSYILGADNTEKVNNIIAFSGYLLDEYKTKEKLDNLEKLNIFISHGKFDDIIPLTMARKTNETFEKNNINIFYKEYEMPHGVSPECLSDALNWLNDK